MPAPPPPSYAATAATSSRRRPPPAFHQSKCCVSLRNTAPRAPVKKARQPPTEFSSASPRPLCRLAPSPPQSPRLFSPHSSLGAILHSTHRNQSAPGLKLATAPPPSRARPTNRATPLALKWTRSFGGRGRGTRTEERQGLV